MNCAGGLVGCAINDKRVIAVRSRYEVQNLVDEVDTGFQPLERFATHARSRPRVDSHEVTTRSFGYGG